ncbi:hypothetical protein [Clostridium sp. AN503]|uniref:hypothetical protein n=1 Tax=Clostridium sp. AN503 TaxID=3160598 RepID=UPI00345995C0
MKQEIESESGQQTEEVSLAEGYQFVRDLGIFAPGSPVIYQMENLNTPEVKNEYGTARLLNAFYQDGNVMLTVLYKDYSVYQLSDEEVREIRQKEKENREKQERGEAIASDDSYFCMDEEKQIYMRSAFLENWQEQNPDDTSPFYEGKMFIQGSKKPGYIFNRASYTRYSYDKYSDIGYIPILVRFIKDGKYPETDGPDGVHELQLDAFEDPFTFEFGKSIELDSLQELPGVVMKEGASLYAEAEREDKAFVVSFYTYSDVGCSIVPQKFSVSADCSDQQTEQLKPGPDLLQSSVTDKDLFVGNANGKLIKSAFIIPDGQDIEGLTVNYEQFAVTDPSEIGTYTFKIPQDEEELEISAEFPDGILYLTKVSRMEEKMKWGTDEDGKDLLKPQIYLTGRVEDKRSDRHVNLIQATDAKSETDGSGSHFYTGNYYPDIDQSESASWYDGKIQGFAIGYEEGEESVTVRFHDAVTKWSTDIKAPVRLR